MIVLSIPNWPLLPTIYVLEILNMSLALPHLFNTTNPLTMPQLVRPTQLSVVPEPDVEACSEFFGEVDEGLDYQDCREAIDSLPTGDAPVFYSPLRPYGIRNEAPNLLVIKTVGTCQLKAFASGQWAEHGDFAIKLIPSDIRDMFENTIRCLGYAGEGGFTTKHFGRTVDWLLAPDTYFPVNPRERGMPRSITFLSAMIWESRDDASFYDPGANNPAITAALYYDLGKLYDKAVREEGPQSLLARKLKLRREFLETQSNKQRAAEPPYWTWWGAQRPRGQRALGSNVSWVDSTSGDNGAATKVQSNVTLGSVTKNITVLDFSNDADAVRLNNEVNSASKLKLDVTASSGVGSSDTSR